MSMCGGCGATKSSERCIGCFHDFGDADSAWVRQHPATAPVAHHEASEPNKTEGGVGQKPEAVDEATSSKPTLFHRMEDGRYAECMAEDAIEEILGVELLGIAFDDYDSSFEIFPMEAGDVAPTADQHARLLALGCSRYWINFRDGAERHCMGERTQTPHNSNRWKSFDLGRNAKRSEIDRLVALRLVEQKAPREAPETDKTEDPRLTRAQASMDAKFRSFGVQEGEAREPFDLLKHDDDLRYVRRVLEAGKGMTDEDRLAAIDIIQKLRVMVRDKYAAIRGEARDAALAVLQSWTSVDDAKPLDEWEAGYRAARNRVRAILADPFSYKSDAAIDAAP